MTKTAPKPRIAVIATAAAVLIAGAVTWAVYNRSASTPPPAPAAIATGAKPPARTLDKPLWRELTRRQQAALKPLQTEWDSLNGVRKRNWLEMSERFASMSPAEQRRVHERMRQWMRLTPAQRELARENFSKTRKLAPGQKTASWESYKQLSEAEKRRLARSGTGRQQGAPSLPHSPIISAPVSCPPGATRRGASCIMPETAPALASGSAAAPATASPAPADAAASQGQAAAVPGAPSPSVQAAPNASNASDLSTVNH
jgi:hypothetical protein